MKSIIKYILVSATAVTVFACKEQLAVYDQPDNKLNFAALKSDTVQRYTFVYEPEEFKQDTVWLDVVTMGYITDYDRRVTLTQAPTVEPQAVEGVHFVSLKDPQITEKYYWIRKGQNSAKIPVVVKRNKDMKQQAFNLRVEIEENGDFKQGYPSRSYRDVTIADILVKPDKWVSPSTFYFLGDYGPVKHQFMIDVLRPFGYRADDEFINMVVPVNPPDMALTAFWGGYFTDKLIELNAERKLLGQDVLREAPKEGQAQGSVVRFYVNQRPQPWE
ncbi:DUF4843 domain-containing protein [Alistipes sp. OttesenSCG-928-B03]|nr:DUF4843 domain-containing protein [Alistipes sp. OttesenSCG-928-B03]